MRKPRTALSRTLATPVARASGPAVSRFISTFFRVGALSEPRHALFLSICVLALPAFAQQMPPAAGMTVAQAVEQALRSYPAIRVTQEQVNAAAAGIRLAQTAYLPRVDAVAQVNRATRNAFYGLLLPQGVIPPVGGVASDNFGSVWDSGVGVARIVATVRSGPSRRQRSRRFGHSGPR